MFNYGDIIEYIDATYDENFNAARKWCKDNNATFDEIVDRRKENIIEKTRQVEKVEDDGNIIYVEEKYNEIELHRFFQINKIPEPSLDELKTLKRAERDRILQSTDIYMLADYPITDAEREQYKQYRQYLRDLPTSLSFPDVEILTFEEYIDNGK